MLTAAPKTRRRRRRRHKRSVAANNTADSNNIDVDDDDSVEDKIEYNERNQTFSPRVNSKFINDDVEIETAMLLKHLTKDSEFELKKDRAIEFFTLNASNGRVEHISGPKDDEQIEIMPSPETTQENFQEGPQLALSYLNNELETVVVPFDRNATIAYDEHQFYMPELTLPKQLPNDIESLAGEASFTRNLVAEGHFLKPKPNISGINQSLFLNRLIEEGSLQWFDFNSKEIKNLFDFTLSRRLIKTFCAEKFHPIDFPPTSILLDYDTFQDRILKIHLKHIYFDVHPTFNDEQKLAREIESLYNEFIAIKQSNILQRIDTKLKILRKLLETVSRGNKSKTQKPLTTDSLQVHRDELKVLRATWHKESARFQEITKNILERWVDLKRIREETTEPSTSLKLKIMVQETVAEQDEHEWSERFEIEHNEMMEEAMELYKKQKALRKKNEKRGLKTESDTQNDKKPIEFVKPNAKKVEQQLLEIFTVSMRPAGEKLIDFELENTNTATIKSPPKYFVRLVLDDGQLEFPDSTKLNSVGQVNVHAVFSIKFTTKVPNKLKFQV